MSSFEDFLEGLADNESGGEPDDGYGAQNGADFLGRWQFGEGALVDLGYVNRDPNWRDNDYGGGWTGKDGVDSINDFLTDHAAQDHAIELWMEKQWQYILHFHLDDYVGQTINGIEMTISGMLAGAHLVGIGGLRDFLRSNGEIVPEDDNHTPITDYMDELGGYDTPFDDPVVPVPQPKPPVPDYVEDGKETWNQAPNTGSPLILDLDGDGAELTAFNALSTTTFFDIDGDSFAEQTAWITANQDGLLVRDLNENGQIDGVEELFGSPSIDGFALLATLDDNADHRIDQYDDVWTDLLIWKDINGDASVQNGELVTLGSLSIASIDLANVAASTATINGNDISHTSFFTFSNGSTGQIVDAWFTHDNTNTYFVGDYTFDSRTLVLPTLRGFGELADLHIAMSMNEDLLEMVEDLAQGFTLASFDEANGWNDAVTEILYEWAGVESVNPASRGPNVDAQHLEFLEEFFGEEFKHWGGNPNPPFSSVGKLIESSWSVIFDSLSAALALQTGAVQLFAVPVIYNPFSGEFEGDTTLSQTAIQSLEDFATDTGVNTEAYWFEVGRFLKETKGFDNFTSTENGWMNDSIVATDAGLSWTGIKALVDYVESGSTITGTGSDETISGTIFADDINGNGGHDTINGLGGDDVLYGHTGNDTINGGDGNDLLDGGSGNDTLYGGAGGDTVYGGYGDDIYMYESGDDVYDDKLDSDTVQLPTGIAIGDLSFYRIEDDSEARHSLVIAVGSLGSIELADAFATNGNYSGWFPTLTFANASTFAFTSLSAITTYGGEGDDDISGAGTGGTGLWNDTIYGYGGDDYLRGGSGNDTLDGGDGNDQLNGNVGNDTYMASAGFDVVEENGGTDVIVMPNSITAGDVILLRLEATPDDLQINIDGLGQIIVDNHFGSANAVVETIQLYGSTITLASTSIETIGTTGNDSIQGITTGASTNDIIDGREGNDSMSGAAGNDIYFFSTGQDTITESTSSTNDRIKFHEGYAPGDIQIYKGGANGKDLILKDANGNALTVTNHFYTAASQIEYVEFYNSTVWTISAMEIETRGTEGDDTFYNYDIGDASTTDTIYAYGGNDDMDAGDGNDLMYGGNGNDILNGQNDNDTLYGEADADTLNGGSGNDLLYGGSGDDNLQGGNDTDLMEGGTGNDTLNGGSGTDTVTYVNAASAVTVSLATTSAQNTGGDGTDTISNTENLTGSSYNDTLTGSTAANTIKGGDGNDTISGGNGNDILYGSAGTDSLTGGANADTFVFELLSAFVNQDTVADFSTAQSDKLDIHDIIDVEFDPATETISQFVDFTNSGGNSIMSIDRDGTGTTYGFVNVATLTGLNNLDETTLYNNGNLLAA